MSQKQLRFLSDGTLCSLFSQGSVKRKPRIDPFLFCEFIKKDQVIIFKKEKIRKFIMGTLAVSIVFSVGLFVFNFIDEGILGVCLTMSFIGSLMVHYLLFPKEDRNKKTNKEYREAFFSILEKEQTLTEVGLKEIFYSLIKRIQFLMIGEKKSSTENLNRIKNIIYCINQTHEERGIVLKVPSNFSGICSQLKQLFPQDADIDQFIQQQSFIIPPGVTVDKTIHIEETLA